MGRQAEHIAAGTIYEVAAKATEYVRARYHKNPAPTLLRSARHRAKLFGLAFDLELSDIVVPTHCPVLGIPLGFAYKDQVPSLDRIIPAKGYVKGNVAVISWRANRLKMNGTLEEFQALVKYLLDKQVQI